MRPRPAAKHVQKYVVPARLISCAPRPVRQKRLKIIRNYVIIDGWLAGAGRRIKAASPQKTKRSIILKQILSPIIQILPQVLFSSIVLAKIGAGRVPLCGLNNRKAPSLPFIEPTERYPARPKFRLQCGASEIRARLASTFVLVALRLVFDPVIQALCAFRRAHLGCNTSHEWRQLGIEIERNWGVEKLRT